MTETRKKPTLHCSECGKPISLNSCNGMIGELYFPCKCGAVHTSQALTNMWEQGVEKGESSLTDKLKSLLRI